MSNEFTINPALDTDALAQAYRTRGRLDVPNFLVPSQADMLLQHLTTRSDWVTVLNAGEKTYELPRARLPELSAQQRQALDQSVIESARANFQYRFDSIRAPDGGGEASPLDRFVAFLSSPTTLDFLARVTGHADIAFADGQATTYRSGDFLTAHDDAVAGKNRRAAYVFGLTPIWSADWGGLLMFHGDDGNITEAFTPGMNRLRLFSVPVRHSVSYVAPFAGASRLSVTGWLRAHPADNQ